MTIELDYKEVRQAILEWLAQAWTFPLDDNVEIEFGDEVVTITPKEQ